jgi:hypothetical protein
VHEHHDAECYGGPDLHAVGSSNAGAVWRTCGRDASRDP